MAEPTGQADSASSGAPAEHLVYQPLSLFAIGGFAIAGIFSLVVLIGFVAAILFDSPWLMPLWTVVIPIFSAVVSLAARLQIQRSEGTLAGLSLTKWGFTLSVLSALIFVSYSIATYVYLRQQAESFARQWFDILKDGRIENAFLYTLPPENRPPDGEQLRDDLENRFNTPTEAARKGFFNEFVQSRVVRSILQGGKETDVKLLGISNYDYIQGGFQVRITYRITTSDYSYDLVVPVYGRKSSQAGAQGRQWQVLMGQLQVRSFTPTEKGVISLSLQSQAQHFAGRWVKSLQEDKIEAAILDQSEPHEREQINQTIGQRYHALIASLPAANVTHPWGNLFPFAVYLASSRGVCVPGYPDFTAAQLLRDNKGKFWAASEQRQQEAYTQVRELFRQPGDGLGRWMVMDLDPPQQNNPHPPLIPWKVVGDRLQVRQDVTINLRGKQTVDGVLIVECDANEAEKAINDGKAAAWRITGLELVRVRDIPTGKPQPGKP